MKETTINFGAFDSEMIRYEWTIPEEYTAKIEDGKVIVEKKNTELTEFEKAIEYLSKLNLDAEYNFSTIKKESERILRLAKEELKKEFVLLHKDDYKTAFDCGKEESIKNIPKWKYKEDSTPLLRDSLVLNKYNTIYNSPAGGIVSNVWTLDYQELHKLPKEE